MLLKVWVNCPTTSKNTKSPDNYHCKQILFRILPHIFHSLVVQLNKSTNFLQVSARKISNIIIKALKRAGGWKNFLKNKLGALIQHLRVANNKAQLS